MAQLLFLEAEDPEKDIYMYINFPGGSVYDGWGILTQCSMLNPTFIQFVGLAASMGAFLLAQAPQKKQP